MSRESSTETLIIRITPTQRDILEKVSIKANKPMSQIIKEYINHLQKLVEKE